MKTCTFFGHRDCPETVKPHLRKVLVDLIVREGVDTFYVGNQGQFDAIVHSVLRELEQVYPEICYCVVLAYLPGKNARYHNRTILPEGIEAVHPRYAIDWRNRWMLQRADFVVTYTTHSWGGAARYVQKAKRMGKTVIPVSPGEA